MDRSTPGSSPPPTPLSGDKGRARRDRQEQLLDEAIEESFPASDPPSAAHFD
jgi:hypothetical protein